MDSQVVLSGSQVPVALDLHWVETALHELQAHRIATWATAELAQMQNTYEDMLNRLPGAAVLLKDRRQKERTEPRQQDIFGCRIVPVSERADEPGRITLGT